MAATRSVTDGHRLGGWAAGWPSDRLPAFAQGPPLFDARLRQRYREERRRLHAARIPLTYGIVFGFGAFATALEFLSFPDRRRLMALSYAAFATICLATIVLVRLRPQRTTILAVIANNALVLCTAAYYIPARAAPEACAMTLVLLLAALPLLNGAGAGVQALSCVGAVLGYPVVLLWGAPSSLPVSYLVTAICGATGVTVLGAFLLDRQRLEAFAARESARRHQADLAHVGRLSVMGEMAAGLAHEINQPLAAIVNFTRGCQRRLRAAGPADPEMIDALEQATAQAMRAAQIIRRIRDFTRKEDPSPTWVDVNDLVRNVADLADADGRQPDVRIDLALSPAVPKIYADSIQIEQVILNLVRNGFDAMNGPATAPKTLSIRTAAATERRVDVTVADTGIGLTPELIDRIFDPFFSTKPLGLGLGLSISRSIVEAHGGRLWAEPSPNGGSEFHFSLAVR